MDVIAAGIEEDDTFGPRASRPAVVYTIAFGLAARRRFSPEVDVRKITAYLYGLCRRSPVMGDADLRKLEAQVRVALGEHYLAGEVEPETATEADAEAIREFVRDLGLTSGELDELVVEAEELSETSFFSAELLIVGGKAPKGGARPVHTERAGLTDPSGSGIPQVPERRRMPRAPHAEPETMVGRWLKALVTDETRVRNSINEDMRRTNEWSSPTTSRVLELAFAIAAYRRFEVDEDVRNLALWVVQVRQRFRMGEYPHMMFEALVRGALGEHVTVTDIPQSTAMMCEALGFGYMIQELGFSAVEVNDLLYLAERSAGVFE